MQEPHSQRLLATLSLIPPLAILPILFIVAGLGELAKVLLIIIGVAPIIVRDVGAAGRGAAGRANHQGANSGCIDLAAGQSCGDSSNGASIDRCPATHVGTCVALPDCGGGHRFDPKGWAIGIFLVRRYLAMDVILPYVAWITLLAFAMDWLLRLARAKWFPWAEATR